MTETKQHTPKCNNCNSNPHLNDDHFGPEWIRGNVVKSEPCGCTIEGRGFLNYPLHIHFCKTHRAALAKAGGEQ